MEHSRMKRDGQVFPGLADDPFDVRKLLARGSNLSEIDLAPANSRRPRTPKIASLRAAIERRELSLHFQPQYEIRGGRQCGVEALARWFLPYGESVDPRTFVRVAEENGLIAALGAWVLHEACETVATWHRNTDQLPILCVNVSPRQITPAFYDVLATTLERTGFPPQRLELEITESILIEEPDASLECLARWKQLGVRIALDDFGTGYSSLSYLSRMPVDRIKIDKSLIHRMTNDEKTAAIVRAIISLGADFGFAVLAEGVESEAQLTMLNGMGCRQAQGFLLALPANSAEAKALLESNWGRRLPLRPDPAGLTTTWSTRES